jgi:hypothetical protein
MVSVGEVKTEVVVDGGEQPQQGGAEPDQRKDQLREVVRELVEEMLERHLRVEERR